MEEEMKPRVVKGSLLVGGAVIFVLLAVSAVTIGVYAANYLVNAFEIISRYGAEDGISVIFQELLSNVIVDYGIGFGRGAVSEGELRSIMALISGMAATVLALLIYPILWLRFARISLAWLQEGFWVFTKDEPDQDSIGSLPDPVDVQSILEEQEVSYDCVTRAEKRFLGSNAKYIPSVFHEYARENAHPILSFAASVTRLAFWATLTGACLLGLFAFLGNEARIPLPAVPEIAREILGHYVVKAGFWIGVLFAASVVFAVFDGRFAKTLVPNSAPAAKRKLDTIRELTAIKPPTQFASIFKSELEVKLKDVGCTPWGLDNTRETFADQSSFLLNIFVEGKSKRKAGYAEPAAKRRLMTATAAVVLGAAILLFGLLPDSVIGVLNGDRFSLLDALVSPLYLVTVLTVGNIIVRKGSRAFKQAVSILNVGWFETPVVIARLDGTVNTQRASTGKAVSDSTGAELRFQQSDFDARMVSATLESFAENVTSPRSIWAFSSDRQSDALLAVVSELLREEGSKSAIQAASRTIADTETVRDATELRRAELRLQVESARKELELLEAPSADETERDDKNDKRN
ncbi:hypothetical protein JMK10_20270 [Rhodovulum sulfidophilum]|uniref:hypothetical protein n=1 Tax=Rhodovulum sulfidophilum TaxID=35806 RepID=UPI001924D886|nr:hypothetical protein [Rhodovulum sulfidophilum]MBL3576344.1 hypothetical protein [Rhodovulum sulfidophilum]MCE8433771.1 hypothetical protein [Rhodovulum sulfidophilum]MCF4119033.1 hypothetical protein [Rhodovulum sulfidophilum]